MSANSHHLIQVIMLVICVFQKKFGGTSIAIQAMTLKWVRRDLCPNRDRAYLKLGRAPNFG